MFVCYIYIIRALTALQAKICTILLNNRERRV